jgi:hypothetical protein
MRGITSSKPSLISNRLLKKVSAGLLPRGRGSVSACKYVIPFLSRARQQAVCSFFSQPAKASTPIEPAPRTAFREYAAVALLIAIIGVLGAAWHHAHGYPLYYGDAESHLGIARKIFDSRTPGYDQIGTVWLPLPHVLMLPFVGSMDMWQSGMAGTIPGVACFTLAGTMLFGVARWAFGSFAAGLTAALLFALNPNILYLASAPMSEPVYLAMVAGVAFFALRGNPIPAALFSCGASMTRYEGWALIPVVALVFLLTRGLRPAILFGAIASIAPMYWLAHNWWYYGNALEFYNGPYSNRMINRGTYPGRYDWSEAWRYYRSAIQLCAGITLTVAGAAGVVFALIRRSWWAVAILLVPPAFFVLSMYSGSTPIFMPHLWPNSYYNTRYGLAALPLLAFGGAALVSAIPNRFRAAGAGVVVLLAITPWIANPRPDAWITWKESEVNSVARRAWTQQAAAFFRDNYRAGDGILFTPGDLTGVLRQAGIPIREALQDGNNPHFLAVMARPDLFLWEEWALAKSADPVSTALLELRSGPFRYECVKMIQVRGDTAIEIYRRVRRHPAP